MRTIERMGEGAHKIEIVRAGTIMSENVRMIENVHTIERAHLRTIERACAYNSVSACAR